MSSYPNEINTIIKECFDEDVRSLELLRTASDSTVYAVTARQKFLLKIVPFAHESMYERFQKLYEYVRTTTACPVPQILLIQPSREQVEVLFVIQDYQSGRQLRSLVEENKTELVVQSLVKVYDLMFEIWKIPVKNVESFWLPNDWLQTNQPTWNQYLREQIDATRLFINNNFSKDTISDVVKKLEDYDTLLIASDLWVPLHGDLIPENVVVNDEGIVVRILDFERARIGDRVWDLAYFEGKLSHYGQSIADSWKSIYWAGLSGYEKKRYELLSILFHVWTIRDGWNQAKNLRVHNNALSSFQTLKNSHG